MPKTAMTAHARFTERLTNSVGSAMIGSVRPPRELLDSIEPPYLAAVLYGSVARGDDGEGSDVDVLAVTRRPFPSRQAGRVSITCYTPEQLISLARAGSLFVLHLRMEGQVLHDPDRAFQRILDCYRPPASYASLRDGLRSATAVLDASEDAFRKNPQGYNRVALFLLRTELYARCAERGTPAFAMDLVARRLDDPSIAAAFSQRGARMSDYRFFMELRDLVTRYLLVEINNPNGTLEAMAVALSERAPLAAVLALRVLTGKTDIEYGLLAQEGILV